MDLSNAIFGVSLAHRRLEALDELPNLEKLSKLCAAVELPAAWLGKLELTTRLRRCGFGTTGFSRLLEASLTGQSGWLEKRLRNDFIEKFHSQMKLAAALGAAFVEADFDLERAALDPAHHRRTGEVLRCVYAPWHRKGPQILLPVRIPLSGGAATAEKLARAMADWMLPKLGAALEVRIHELRFDDALQATVNAFRYNTKIVRMVYEPELGNTPSEALIKRVAALAGELHGNVPLLFAPVHAAAETLEGQTLLYPPLFDAVRNAEKERKC